MRNFFLITFGVGLLIGLGIVLSGSAGAVLQTATPTPLQPVEYQATIDAQQATIQAQQQTLDAMQMTLAAIVESTSAAPIPTIDPLLLPSVPASSTPTITVSPASDGCLRHVVQAGDTVSAIAQQYGVAINDIFVSNGIGETTILQIGDVLIVPVEGCAVPATPTPVPSATPVLPTATPFNLPPPGPTATPTATPLNVQVQITSVLAPGDINNEAIEITNLGDVIDLQGWRLMTMRGEIFRFPEFRFSTGSTLHVYSRRGSNTPAALYWGRDTAAWRAGETVTLTDSTGQERATFTVSGTP
jgi:LysM repeat protein